ncbi:MAG: GIY-YIG nuclease family protein [Lysobacter sp.]
MKVFPLLTSINSAVTAVDCKVYLHQPVRDEDGEGRPWMYPLEMWKDGSFEEWQRFQNRGYFTTPFIVSLIRNEWGGYMFAGVFRVLGSKQWAEGRSARLYDLERLPEFDDLNGRLHVHCRDKTERGVCFFGSTLDERLTVQQITERRLGTPDFPGFRNVRLSKLDLDRVVHAQDPRWRGPLSAVKGIYLISDMAKHLVYVGMAAGADGFWGRWSCYSHTGHGGNKKMIALLDELAEGHAENFTFSILEIADLNTSDETLGVRESHWKELLHTRVSLNAN